MTNEELIREVERLNARLEKLESTYSVAPRMPKTALISDSFIKRAFAVYGHSMVAGLIIGIPIWIVTVGVLLYFGVY